jgi:hypothetical protein
MFPIVAGYDSFSNGAPRLRLVEENVEGLTIGITVVTTISVLAPARRAELDTLRQVFRFKPGLVQIER